MDEVRAHMWLNLAAVKDVFVFSSMSRQQRDRVAELLTPQIDQSAKNGS